MKVRAAGPAIVSLAFLVVALFGRWPYGFYTLMRFVVCESGVFLALRANEIKKSLWVWLMGGIAVLFNPLLPIRVHRSDGQFLDLITAVLFAISIPVITKKRNERER